MVTSYPPEWDDQEAREDAIEARAQALLDEDCDPMCFDNIVEYLCEKLTTVQQAEFLAMFHGSKSVMPNLHEGLHKYWEAAAYRLAEHEIDHP